MCLILGYSVGNFERILRYAKPMNSSRESSTISHPRNDQPNMPVGPTSVYLYLFNIDLEFHGTERDGGAQKDIRIEAK
jgi:hypothetical protein